MDRIRGGESDGFFVFEQALHEVAGIFLIIEDEHFDARDIIGPIRERGRAGQGVG